MSFSSLKRADCQSFSLQRGGKYQIYHGIFRSRKSKEEMSPFLNSYLGQWLEFWVTAKWKLKESWGLRFRGTSMLLTHSTVLWGHDIHLGLFYSFCQKRFQASHVHYVIQTMCKVFEQKCIKRKITFIFQICFPVCWVTKLVSSVLVLPIFIESYFRVKHATFA